MNVTEAGSKECEESKMFLFYFWLAFDYYFINYTVYKNVHSEGQGHVIEHTDLNTETWTVTHLCQTFIHSVNTHYFYIL